MKKIFLIVLFLGFLSIPVDAQIVRFGSGTPQPTHRNRSDVMLENGIYTVKVKYESSTGHRAMYTLDVKIHQDVVKCIYFDDGGYLDVNVARNNNMAWLGGGIEWEVDYYGNIESGKAVVTINKGASPYQTFTIYIL